MLNSLVFGPGMTENKTLVARERLALVMIMVMMGIGSAAVDLNR